MDNGAYGRPPYRLPEKFRLADTIGRKPRCEVGVFIFGQPGFHNAAAVGCVVFLSHLWQKMSEMPEVGDTIRRDGRVVFENSILPKVFDEAARKAYVENTESFTSLFEDSAKYKAMMSAIGELLISHFIGK